MLAGIEELLIGYLKLEEGWADCSAEPVAVDGGAVTPVPEKMMVVRDEIVSCALLSLIDGRTEAVSEYAGGAMVVRVVAVIPPVSDGDDP